MKIIKESRKDQYMANQLHAARANKDDEFYTQYGDIEAQMNDFIEYDKDVFRGKTVLLPCDDPEWSNFTKYFAENFGRLGLKKLISTSYAPGAANRQITMYEQLSPNFDESKHDTHGKLFVIENDIDGSGKIDMNDVEFSYLEGDGDFRSEEVKALRDESDIIITNPPFSLIIPFVAWIVEADKKFAIIANQNVYTDKDIFPLIKDNKIWVGSHSGDMAFMVPPDSEPRETRYWEDETGQKWRSLGNATWLTNLEHGIKREKLILMSMADNLKYNNALKKKLASKFNMDTYPHYDNYDAIEIPLSNSVPSDYDGVMGVPVTFLDKYNPEQFEIVGMTHSGLINGEQMYARILIKHRKDD